MIEQLIAWDQELFLYLNGIHNSFWDVLMYWITKSKTWIPFYLLLVGYVIYQFRWKSIYVFLFVGLVITLADQTTSGFMKPFFERFRPSHEPALEGLVHIVKGKGGKFGFASSHAANTFGLSAFLYYFFRAYGIRFFSWLFVWAAIVSYSRIYVGVHYPLDIIVGGLIGWGYGYLISIIALKFLKNKTELYSRRSFKQRE